MNLWLRLGRILLAVAPCAASASDLSVLLEPGPAPAPPACAGPQPANAAKTPPASRLAESVRIGFWGDSHLASGHFVAGALREWGAASSQVRPAFVAPPDPSGAPVWGVRAACASNGWTRTAANRIRIANPAGLSPFAMVGEGADAVLAWDFRWPDESSRVSGLRLWITGAEPGRRPVVALSVDAGPERIVALPAQHEAVVSAHAPAPFTTLRIRVVAGRPVVWGVELAHERPPAYLVDVFGSPGATASGLGGVRAPAGTTYDLAVIAFGTNEAAAPGFRPGQYADALRHSLGRFTAQVPHSRCVLVTPPDRAPSEQGQALSRRHAQLAVVQAMVARSLGCGVWDWQSWMRIEAPPELMLRDQTHLTPAGYRSSGQAFAARFNPGAR